MRSFVKSYDLLNPNSVSLSAALLLAGLVLIAAPTHAEGLDGQPVQVTFREPDTATVVENAGTQTVTYSGATFLQNGGLPAFMSIIVSPTNIVFTPTNHDPNSGIGFPNFGFRGYDVSEVGQKPSDITGVSIDPTTSVYSQMIGPETFNTDRVTFDAHNVFVNFQAISMDGGSNLTLDVTTAPAAVPEPSSLAPFAVAGLGLTGLIIRARKKKATHSLKSVERNAKR